MLILNMMKLDFIKNRINELLSHGQNVINSEYPSDAGMMGTFYFLNDELFIEWRAASLSFLNAVFGKDHIFLQKFNDANSSTPTAYIVKKGIGVLKAAKQEIDGGWLTSFKGLVSAEIFSDFLEMAEHLLEQGYKDPAAVMIGSVLEEHLRQLCQNNSLPIDTIKDGKSIPKKADAMNADLTKAGIYNLLSQKSVTAWLDLRNKAAHGQYNEYTEQEVKLMYQGVIDFIGRTS